MWQGLSSLFTPHSIFHKQLLRRSGIALFISTIIFGAFFIICLTAAPGMRLFFNLYALAVLVLFICSCILGAMCISEDLEFGVKSFLTPLPISQRRYILENILGDMVVLLLTAFIYIPLCIGILKLIEIVFPSIFHLDIKNLQPFFRFLAPFRESPSICSFFRIGNYDWDQAVHSIWGWCLLAYILGFFCGTCIKKVMPSIFLCFVLYPLFVYLFPWVLQWIIGVVLFIISIGMLCITRLRKSDQGFPYHIEHCFSGNSLFDKEIRKHRTQWVIVFILPFLLVVIHFISRMTQEQEALLPIFGLSIILGSWLGLTTFENSELAASGQLIEQLPVSKGHVLSIKLINVFLIYGLYAFIVFNIFSASGAYKMPEIDDDPRMLCGPSSVVPYSKPTLFSILFDELLISDSASRYFTGLAVGLQMMLLCAIFKHYLFGSIFALNFSALLLIGLYRLRPIQTFNITGFVWAPIPILIIWYYYQYCRSKIEEMGLKKRINLLIVFCIIFFTVSILLVFAFPNILYALGVGRMYYIKDDFHSFLPM